jgi:hypothetical protein
MRLDMRLVQRAGMDDRLYLEFAHRAAHEITIFDRADDLGQRRGNRVEADDLVAVALEPWRQSLAEPAGGAGEENAHGGVF